MPDIPYMGPSCLTPPETNSAFAARVPVTGPPTNVVAYGDGRFTWNQNNVRVAMSPKRIRIGCTEVSVEAVREIMQQHALRFGKPPEEIWQQVQ